MDGGRADGGGICLYYHVQSRVANKLLANEMVLVPLMLPHALACGSTDGVPLRPENLVPVFVCDVRVRVCASVRVRVHPRARRH